MVAVGQTSAGLMANYANTLNPLPKLHLRGSDQMQKKIWDARLKDRLSDFGHPDFFDESPPQYSLAILADRTSQIKYQQACDFWWLVNDYIFDLIENSLELGGPQFERDFDKLRSFRAHSEAGERYAKTLLL